MTRCLALTSVLLLIPVIFCQTEGRFFRLVMNYYRVHTLPFSIVSSLLNTIGDSRVQVDDVGLMVTVVLHAGHGGEHALNAGIRPAFQTEGRFETTEEIGGK